MEGFSFHEGNVPSEEQFLFEPSLYNLPQHRFLQSPMGWHSYFVEDVAEKKVVACIHFNLSEGVAFSPFRSPFGSVECNPAVPPDVIFDFIRFFEIRLKSKGAKTIVIKHYPDAYDERQSIILQTFMLNYGYVVSTADVASIIDIGGDLPEENFHRSEQKRLDKALQSGLQFRELRIEEFQNVYKFIESCRQEKQYSLSMAMHDLKEVIKRFPGRVALFGVFHQNDCAAASISIRVRDGILYDFYHDHTARFDNVSPVVLLVAGIYEYCQRNQIRLLDLGTSTLPNGQPNFGLLRFKKNLGARFTRKFTFEKNLSA